jgi:hypothetical protein
VVLYWQKRSDVVDHTLTVRCDGGGRGGVLLYIYKKDFCGREKVVMVTSEVEDTTQEGGGLLLTGSLGTP